MGSAEHAFLLNDHDAGVCQGQGAESASETERPGWTRVRLEVESRRGQESVDWTQVAKAVLHVRPRVRERVQTRGVGG